MAMSQNPGTPVNIPKAFKIDCFWRVIIPKKVPKVLTHNHKNQTSANGSPCHPGEAREENVQRPKEPRRPPGSSEAAEKPLGFYILLGEKARKQQTKQERGCYKCSTYGRCVMSSLSAFVITLNPASMMSLFFLLSLWFAEAAFYDWQSCSSMTFLNLLGAQIVVF